MIEAEDDLVDGTYKQPNKTHDMHHLIDKTALVCSATIAPREVPEVQEMMRLCNEFEIPVWPFSIGRNTGYGGAAPRVPGSICLELGKHMNKILEVNTEDAFALLEPGVTYQGFHEYLEEHNLREKVWMDVSCSSTLRYVLLTTFYLKVPDLGGGSVIGNAIERGVGYTPYGGRL